jgi:hypothetical protein
VQYTLFFSVVKTNQFVLFKKNVAGGSYISTKHINALWEEGTILPFRPVGASSNQLVLKC